MAIYGVTCFLQTSAKGEELSQQEQAGLLIPLQVFCTLRKRTEPFLGVALVRLCCAKLAALALGRRVPALSYSCHSSFRWYGCVQCTVPSGLVFAVANSCVTDPCWHPISGSLCSYLLWLQSWVCRKPPLLAIMILCRILCWSLPALALTALPAVPGRTFQLTHAASFFFVRLPLLDALLSCHFYCRPSRVRLTERLA